MPCWKRPYGTLSSYDLNTGKLNWREPFGAGAEMGLLHARKLGLGDHRRPVITKSGLIFIGASMDSRVRAIDLKTGNVLWKSQVEAPAVAQPAVYTYKGKEYVVFAAGGNSILEPQVERPAGRLRPAAAEPMSRAFVNEKPPARPSSAQARTRRKAWPKSIVASSLISGFEVRQGRSGWMIARLNKDGSFDSWVEE